MQELIDKVQEQLDKNWPVEADDIQALIDINKSLKDISDARSDLIDRQNRIIKTITV